MTEPLTVATDPARPRCVPDAPLREALGVPALAGARAMMAAGEDVTGRVGFGRVGGHFFAGRDKHKFKMVARLSSNQVGSTMFKRLYALDQAGLGDMACADALAWLCAAEYTKSNRGLPDLVRRWEQFTNHGWFAHLAGFSIEEVESLGHAPGDAVVRSLLVLQGDEWKRAALKMRTPERLGPLATLKT